MQRDIHIIGCCVVLMLSGCGESGDQTGKTNGDVIRIGEAESELVLARIGDFPVTCGDFRSRVDFERELWRMRHPQKKDDKVAIESFRRQRMPKIIPELLNQAGVRAWMDCNRIPFTAEEREKAEKEGLAALGFKKDIAAFSRALSCTPEYASAQLCASSRMRKACLAFEPDADAVTEKEIDEGLERLAAYYERAVSSNRVTWVTCSNAIERVSRGLSFADAAREYSYSDPEEGELWGDFLISSIQDEKLRNWLNGASVGEMKIFELDDGISIVRVLGRTEGETVKSGAGERDADVSLARINFAMVEPEPEPRTREHVREALRKWKMGEVQKRLGAKILERFPVSYPNENAKIVF